MDSIKKLEAYFAEFPGIGPRQAKRFVYFLLHKNKAWSGELSRVISEIHSEVSICSECFRIYTASANRNITHAQTGPSLCSICSNPHRDKSLLMIVSRDIDLDAIERSGVFQGLYFVLGGTVPILEKEPEKKIRARELKVRVSRVAPAGEDALSEIVIATSANPEGENTGDYVHELLGKIAEEKSIQISYRGRGLSTGSELEYSDKETLKNALENRR